MIGRLRFYELAAGLRAQSKSAESTADAIESMLGRMSDKEVDEAWARYESEKAAGDAVNLLSSKGGNS